MTEKETILAAKVQAHARICQKLNEIYTQKNHDYGDAFGKGYAEYGVDAQTDMMIEEMSELTKAFCTADPLVKDESTNDTLMDLANYAIMTLVEQERMKNDE